MSHDSIKIAVHDGTYHTDDVFAMAITILWAHKKDYDCSMIRTRDQAELDSSQVILDVGGEYDPDSHRYDHHQRSFVEKHDNGIPYASAGLAWKHYGLLLCEGNESVWRDIESKIISPIDAGDTGVDLWSVAHPSKVLPFDIGSLTALSRPTSIEERADPDNAMNKAFWLMLEYAKLILTRALYHGHAKFHDQEKVKQFYNDAADKRIVIADYEYPVWVSLLSEFPEPLFFVYKKKNGHYGAKAVRKYGTISFEARILFPENWRGLRAVELQEISGIKGAQFCHDAGFYCNADSLEAILALCKYAIERY